MTQTMTNLELMSSLADGRLAGGDLARAVGLAHDDQEARVAWQRYHLIGEALRTGRHEPCTDTSDFVARLRGRLADEAPIATAPVLQPVAFESHMVRAEAVNEPVFRWKMVAGVASLAAAAAIGWTWIGAGNSAPAGPQMAQSSMPG
ncbi:MAG: anti-sigma factor, partial [Comamonadaceae bacterium]